MSWLGASCVNTAPAWAAGPEVLSVEKARVFYRAQPSLFQLSPEVQLHTAALGAFLAAARFVRVRIHRPAAALLLAAGGPASHSFECRRYPGFPRCREGPAGPRQWCSTRPRSRECAGLLSLLGSHCRARPCEGGAAMALPRRQGALRRRRAGGAAGGGVARAHVRVPRATGRSRRDVTVLPGDVRWAHAPWPRRFCVTSRGRP